MSERCEGTSKRRSEWPSTLRVDIIAILPIVHSPQHSSADINGDSRRLLARDDGNDADEDNDGVDGVTIGDRDSEFCQNLTKQSLRTFEFGVGVVLQTISYLRLWVLSLAHSLISEVSTKTEMKHMKKND